MSALIIIAGAFNIFGAGLWGSNVLRNAIGGRRQEADDWWHMLSALFVGGIAITYGAMLA